MGRGNLNEEEIRTLRKNPYVVDVNERGVSYSKDFKFLFIKEYMQGKKPTAIFKDAGFDVKVLGSKRIERACARWKESYEAGTLGVRSAKLEKYGSVGARRIENDAIDDEIDRLKESALDICRNQMKEIKRISAENEMLKYILEEASGASARVAKSGAADPNGKPGPNGATGPNGKNGRTETNGQTGSNGKTDKPGASGRAGNPGSIGTEKLCMIIRDVSEKAEFQGCVSYLCRSAGISRNTYYSYCRSKQ